MKHLVVVEPIAESTIRFLNRLLNEYQYYIHIYLDMNIRRGGKGVYHFIDRFTAVFHASENSLFFENAIEFIHYVIILN